MSNTTIHDITAIISSKVAKARRFSSFSQEGICELNPDLVRIWQVVCSYLSDQIRLKKSVNFLGIGSFFVQHSKVLGLTGEYTESSWSLRFLPDVNWSKLPGYKIDRNLNGGTLAAEHLNFAMLATKLQIKRSDIEAGLKDIIYGLTKLVSLGSALSLTIDNVGKLKFDTGKVKFAFSQPLLSSLNEKHSTIVLKAVQTSAQPQLLEKEINLTKENPVPVPDTVINEHAREETAKFLKIEEEKETAKFPKMEEETVKLSEELEKATRKLESIEKLIGETFQDNSTQATHTHSHTGNRYWKDNSCTICQAESIENTIDLIKIKQAEKDNDKMLLHISLDIDKEYLDKKKEIKNKQTQLLVESGKENLAASIEKRKKDANKVIEPMGDIFDGKRKVIQPLMCIADMKKGIQEQILDKRRRFEKNAEINALNEKLLCERLKKEIRSLDLQQQLSKIQKSRELQSSLSEQIRLYHVLHDKKEERSNENPFARSESLLELYRKEKAKQIYQEQVAIVQKRQEYAKKIREFKLRQDFAKNEIAQKQ